MIKALVIDDEEDARQMLHLALKRYCPNVDILALCESASEGLEKIRSLKPDLVFLDIQMPIMSGFDVLEKVPDPDFDVIFVTAYNQYAIKAIRFSALDYLLKPIAIEELVAAVNRIEKESRKNIRHYHSLLKNMRTSAQKLARLAIPSDNEIIIQAVADIMYCKADGSYTQLYLINGKKLLVCKNIKEFENMLAENAFFRIHHSYLVNTAYIQKYVRGEGGYVVINDDMHLTVSRRKKDGLLQMLQR